MHREQSKSSHVSPATSLVLGVIAAAVLSIVSLVRGAEQTVDLDGNPINGAESKVVTKVLQTYPVKIENTVLNNVGGAAYTFSWPGAGPGGFASFVTAGPGVGTIWTWTTVQQVYTIQSPVTFTPMLGIPVFGTPPQGVQTFGGDNGVFPAPGKSLSPTQVTLSSASLTSSLITFFSPEVTVASCGASCVPGQCDLFFENQSGATTTIMATQQACCPEPRQIICDADCKSYLTDTENCGDCGIACGPGEFCSGGQCFCPAGQTQCGAGCVNLDNDPSHCGSCGNVCGFGEICAEAECFPCALINQTACNNACVDFEVDPNNCGSCGAVCDFSGCTTGTGSCGEGECVCDPSLSSPTSQTTASSATGTTAKAAIGQSRKEPGGALPGQALARSKAGVLPTPPGRSRTGPGPVGQEPVLAAALAASVMEAPVCDLQAIEQVIPSGGTFTQTQTGGRVNKEIQTTISLAANGQTVAQGPCALIVPDTNVDTTVVLPSTLLVATVDSSGDGLCQPTEAQCDYLITVANLGDTPCLNPLATLSSAPDQFNPNQIIFLNSTSPYPTLPVYPGNGIPLAKKTNSVAFSLTTQSDQAPDVGRVFQLSFDCTNQPGPVLMPLVLGIGSVCNPLTDIDGETYDRLNGFQSPVSTRLVPKGSPVNFSSAKFRLGSTIPLKFTLGCGILNLTGAQINPKPQIVAIDHETLGPQSLVGINGDNSANPNDPRFTCGTSRCEYQFRTNPLPIGNLVISVRMPDSRIFQAGFKISP